MISHAGAGAGHPRQLAGQHPRRRRGIAAAARCRPSSTSTTSTGSTRTCPSRTPSERWPSWSPRARSATSGCPRPARTPSAGPTPSTRSPRCSPSTRCGPGTPRPGPCPVLRELGIGFVAYSPLGRGLLTGDGALDRRPRRHRLPPDQPPLHRRELRPQPEPAPTRSRPSPPRSGARRPRSRWPGCWPRATTSSPSRAPSGCHGWRRTWPPTPSSSAPTSSPASTGSPRPPVTTTARSRCG